jgi:hypothetical protein
VDRAYEQIHHSKRNKWDTTVDALQVRKRIEHWTSENCERDKRNYTKGTNKYWSDIIFKQRAAKIYEEMSLVADKYSENDPVPCSIDDTAAWFGASLQQRRRLQTVLWYDGRSCLFTST